MSPQSTGPAKLWDNKGKEFLRKKEYKNAADAFNKAILLNPDLNQHIWNNLGTAHYESGCYPEALTAFQCSVDKYPDNATSWFNLGKTHLQSGQFKHAIQCFDHVIDSGNSSLLRRAVECKEEAERRERVQNNIPQVSRCISYPEALLQLRESISQIDAIGDEDWIVTNIPNGPQMIRGIAGSGKTLKICQKAAYIHAKHPEWNIAVVFFSRSLYGYITRLVKKYTRLNGIAWDPKNPGTLEVIHAWGGRGRKGLYSEICRAHDVRAKIARDYPGLSPMEGFASACKDLLDSVDIEPSYDVILLDEAQDFVVDDESLLFKNRQPIYWMAYMALKPFNPNRPELRRLIWAFDEYQNINSLKVPTTAEIFGDSEEFRKIMTGKGRSYIMDQCYRTPMEILMAAHALGMGIYFREGMQSGPTTKKAWQDLGYQINGSFNFGNTVELWRTHQTSPNPISRIWEQSLMNADVYSERDDEYAALASSIRQNITKDGLLPDDILVISLLERKEGNQSQKDISSTLSEFGITNYISSTSGIGMTDIGENKDVFSVPGAVTVSGINRVKGNEGNMVYIVGLDTVGKKEANIHARNSLFIAITRSKAWIHLSGIGDYGIYDEIQQVMEDINSLGKLKFEYKKPPKWCLDNLYDPESSISYQSTLTAF